MADSLIPARVREFIASNIDSIAELEALLLIRSDPETYWSIDALAERLYITPGQTDDAMAKLHAIGVAGAREGKPLTYHYRASSSELDGVIDGLAEAYSKYLIPVTNLIHSKPQSKVQQFADAFRLRKKEDE